MLIDVILFLASAYIFGPGATITVFIERYNHVLMILALLIIYILPIPLLYSVLIKLDERSGEVGALHRFVERVRESVQDKGTFTGKLLDKLIEKFGADGYFLFLIFIDAVMGFTWATFVSFVLRIPLRRTMLANSIGGFLAVIFWYLIVKTAYSFLGTALTIPLLILVTISLLYSYIRAFLKGRSFL